ncbi:MAG: hypothetical protein COA82_03530 [Alkaliphilus sp.]|nr:MAG: hypothetical protein COA82_03530 [Alkaliphilus sp.]
MTKFEKLVLDHFSNQSKHNSIDNTAIEDKYKRVLENAAVMNMKLDDYDNRLANIEADLAQLDDNAFENLSIVYSEDVDTLIEFKRKLKRYYIEQAMYLDVEIDGYRIIT